MNKTDAGSQKHGSPSAALKCRNKRARMALKMIERREQQFIRQRDEAVNKHSWSQVPGYDGISIGLQIAHGILLQEFMPRRRPRGNGHRSKQEET